MTSPWFVQIVFGTIGLSMAIAAAAFAFIVIRFAIDMWRD
jgi:hypothetical protein